MSIYAINVTSIIAASVVFLGYVIFVILRARHKIDEAKERWSGRIEKMSSSSSESGDAIDGGHIDNPLIKTKTNAESYFTSKLPKVEGLNEWILHAGIEVNIFVFLGLSFVIGLFVGATFFLFIHTNVTLSILFGVAGMFFLPWGSS